MSSKFYAYKTVWLCIKSLQGPEINLPMAWLPEQNLCRHRFYKGPLAGISLDIYQLFDITVVPVFLPGEFYC